MINIFYITTKIFPGSTADHIYILEIAKAFTQDTNKNFTLVMTKKSGDLKNLQTQEWSSVKGSRLLGIIFSLFKNAVSLNKQDKNVFITNDFYIGVVLVFLRPFLFRNVKLIFDAHLLSDTWKDKFVLKRMNAIISTSEVLSGHIANLGINKKKIHPIIGGVNLEIYNGLSKEEVVEYRKKYNIDPSEVIVGYIGGFFSLKKEKGMADMIKSLRYLPKNTSMVLVGGSEQEVEEYRLLSEQLEVADKCFIRGKILSKEVPLAQMSCDILVIPYPNQPHFSKYGFPMKVFEYLATKKPIVYSNLKIIHNVLNKFENCFSFEPSNPVSLSQAIMRARELNNTKEFNIEQYSWKSKSDRIASLIDSLFAM